jgi:hypothetical protein
MRRDEGVIAIIGRSKTDFARSVTESFGTRGVRLIAAPWIGGTARDYAVR